MLVGSVVVAMCLLLLGWTTEIVRMFVKDAEKVPALLLFFWWHATA